MSERAEFEQQVIKWIAEWRGVPTSTIDADRPIEGPPLRATGDDVVEMLEFVADKSGGNFSDFDFVSYFNVESSICDIFMRMSRKWPRKRSGTPRVIADFLFDKGHRASA